MGRPVNIFLQYYALDAFRAGKINADHALSPEATPMQAPVIRAHPGQHWSELLKQAKDVGDVDIQACIEKPPVANAFEQLAETQPEVTEKLVIFAWSGELDKIWPTLILATTGAAMGKETTVFFTFWGLFPLVKNEVRLTGKNWMQKMLSMMNRGGDEHLKLSKMNFVGAGPAMMNHLAKANHVASPHELMAMAKEMGVHLIPCQMTMDMLGLKREDLIDGLEEPAGATKALADAQGAITLFI